MIPDNGFIKEHPNLRKVNTHTEEQRQWIKDNCYYYQFTNWVIDTNTFEHVPVACYIDKQSYVWYSLKWA